MYCTGIIITIGSEFFKFGKLSSFKCQMGYSMFFVGLTISYIPILYILLITIPDMRSSIKFYCKRHKVKFIIICVLIEIALNLLFIATPFTVNDDILHKNYNRCTMKSTFAIILIQAITNYVNLYVIKIYMMKNSIKTRKQIISSNIPVSSMSTKVEVLTDPSYNDPKCSNVKKMIIYHYTQWSIVNEMGLNSFIKTTNTMSENNNSIT
ncbi:hypothetical protein PIROE2DRAFT_13695, partial [Piromyces sp. E2]